MKSAINFQEFHLYEILLLNVQIFTGFAFTCMSLINQFSHTSLVDLRKGTRDACISCKNSWIWNQNGTLSTPTLSSHFSKKFGYMKKHHVLAQWSMLAHFGCDLSLLNLCLCNIIKNNMVNITSRKCQLDPPEDLEKNLYFKYVWQNIKNLH